MLDKVLSEFDFLATNKPILAFSGSANGKITGFPVFEEDIATAE
jgi:hypothetical protein